MSVTEVGRGLRIKCDIVRIEAVGRALKLYGVEVSQVTFAFAHCAQVFRRTTVVSRS
jgi:hypothetical protein